MKLLRLIFVPLCLCGALLFSGCSSVSEQPLLAQIAVQYATIKVVAHHPERAARVATIAHALRATASGEAAASVAVLEAYVRTQIKWENLDPADTLLVDTLVRGISAELTQRLGAGVLDPKQRLVVAQVAGWIEAAATAELQQAATPPPAASAASTPRSSTSEARATAFCQG